MGNFSWRLQYWGIAIDGKPPFSLQACSPSLVINFLFYLVQIHFRCWFCSEKSFYKYLLFCNEGWRISDKRGGICHKNAFESNACQTQQWVPKEELNGYGHIGPFADEEPLAQKAFPNVQQILTSDNFLAANSPNQPLQWTNWQISCSLKSSCIFGR